MSGAEVGSRSGVGLVRELGLLDITMVGVGAMIGAGIFVLTGIAAGEAGPALILAFALNGVVTLLTGMVYAELGSAIPEAGGGYLWVKEGMPAWNAFMAGWMSWFAHAVAGSLYALGFGAYLELMLDEFGVSLLGLTGDPLQKGLAVGVALLFVGINFKGVSETGKVGNLVTIGKIGILAIFVVSGLVAVLRNPEFMDKLTPFAPHGMGGILIAMGLTFIAFEGYEIIAQAGEEVKNPRENIPKAVFLSLAIVIPIYMLVAFTALTAVTPATGEPTWQWLGLHAELGLAEAARQFMPLGMTLLLIGGILSTMSALNATTFSSTRVSFAMGRDRNLPDLFGRIHEATRTPFLALLCSGALIIFMAVVIPIEDVAAAADVMFLLLFLQVNIAVITIRKKYGDKLNYGYLMPFHPVLPVINMGLIAVLAAFMFQFSPLAWFFVVGWLAVGFVIYLGYAAGREREKKVTPVVLEERWEYSEEGPRVLAALPAAEEDIGRIVDVAGRISRAIEGELLLLHVATVAPQTPLRAGRAVVERTRQLLEGAEELAKKTGVKARRIVRLGHHPSSGIVDTAEEADVEFVVMGWHRRPDPRRHFGRNIDPVMREVSGTVVAILDTVSVPAGRILVPVADPENASDLVGLARLLVKDGPGGRITALHVIPPDLNPDARDKRLEELREGLARPAFFDPKDAVSLIDGGRIGLEVVESSQMARAIGEATRGQDLLIVGSSEESWFRRRIFGRTSFYIAHRAQCPVIVINRRTPTVKFEFQTFFEFFRQGAEEA
ncbi:MAG: amino acid permease [Gemmatimonadota bacterium]